MRKRDLNSERTLVILLYHGVTDVASTGIENYSGKHCKRDEFVRQMLTLKEKCVLLSIDDVVEYYNAKRTLPRNATVVTFDDGFKNSFEVAVPILSRLKIPATFYLTTGFIGTKNMFWVDALEDCINRCVKKSIDIKLGNKKKKISLADRRPRIAAVEFIKNYCKKVLASNKKKSMIEAISAITGIKPSVNASKNYETMSWDDVREINSNPLFTIGGHSLSHNILSKLPAKAVKDEIYIPIRELESKLGERVRHYSYPEGQQGDYDKKTIKYLKGLGIICCPSAIDGVNTLNDDLFHLKRIMVGFNKRAFPFD